MNIVTASPTQPWLITLEAYRNLAAALGTALPVQTGKEEAPTAPYAAKNGVAVIPIHGTMMRQVRPQLKSRAEVWGIRLCDMQQASDTLRQAAADATIHTVILDIDSPGGTVNGTPELAHAVATLSDSKHVYAFTSGQCCSAAYWIASQTDGIYASPSAIVGSIGVILPILDATARYEKEGFKVEVFSAGKYKSTGVEGTSLTDERFAENMDGARRAGLMCGAYHYYSPGSSARRQADFFVRHVHLQPGDLPPVLDIEQTGDLSSRALRDSALVWLRLVERHYGVRPILYTYHNFRSRHLSTPVFDDYPYWIAHYYVDTLHYEGRWHFWQHTDRGRVAGIKGNVDINCFNGSVYALRQLTLGEE